jgi:hypothetical protein
MEGSELTSKFEGRTPMAKIEYFKNNPASLPASCFAIGCDAGVVRGSGPALINLRTYRRGVSRSMEMSVFSDRFTETVPLAGKTRSYREQIDRFIESVSFVRTHATERDSL